VDQLSTYQDVLDIRPIAHVAHCISVVDTVGPYIQPLQLNTHKMITTYASLMVPPRWEEAGQEGAGACDRQVSDSRSRSRAVLVPVPACLPDLLDNGIAQVPQGKGGVEGDGFRPIGTLVKIGDL
jgi:hypothetical protein